MPRHRARLREANRCEPVRRPSLCGLRRTGGRSVTSGLKAQPLTGYCLWLSVCLVTTRWAYEGSCSNRIDLKVMADTAHPPRWTGNRPDASLLITYTHNETLLSSPTQRVTTTEEAFIESLKSMPLLLWDAMGLFGPSKSELADRIDELEETVDEYDSRLTRAQTKAGTAHDRARTAERNATEQAENAARVAHALNDVVTRNIKPLEDRDGEEVTLDEPRIAWKATSNHVAKLLIPEGATVIHPNKGNVGHGGKKRADEAVPLAFYDVNTETVYETTKFGGNNRVENEYIEESEALTVTDHSRRRSGACAFEYTIGETAEPELRLNESLDSECVSGIHFFATKEEALDWY